MTVGTIRKVAIIVVTGAGLALAASAAFAGPGRPANGSASTGAQLSAVQHAFAQAEDVYEAMFAPPPATRMAASALEDNLAVAPVATLDRTGHRALLTATDQNVIESRGITALSNVYAPALADRMYKILVGVVGTISSGQDLLGGGGASVVKYQSESISGSTAKITASVAQWSRIGYVDPQTGVQHWQVNRAIVIVHDTLQRTASGQWQVTSRVWQYAPGQGP